MGQREPGKPSRSRPLLNRLWIRLTFTVSTGIFLSMALLVVLVLVDNTVQLRKLDPEFQAGIRHIAANGGLDNPANADEFRELLVGYLQTEEGFAQSMQALLANFEMQGRLIRLAALFALPFGLGTALLVSRSLSKSINTISSAARRVAAGDFAARALLPGRTGPDSELGGLIRDFNRMAANLERLEQERQNMITDVAHELRTPLTIVQGQVDAMQFGVLPLDAEQLAKLSRHIELLSRLIRDLRTLSLADAQRLSLTVHVIDLWALTSDIIDGFQDQALAQGITLTLAGGSEGGLLVNADGDRIAQILINLVSNALRHTPQGGSVRVVLQGSDETVLLTVADSGEGLTPEAARSVFERFYRTDASRNRASGGSGLGLSIARALAELHGGSLTAGTARAGGAEFRLTLPRLS
jgi:signal transduction histidine kinase